MTKSGSQACDRRRQRSLLEGAPTILREVVRAVMQEMLDAEMIDALGAEKGERTMARLGYRADRC
jgi:putative transposase